MNDEFELLIDDFPEHANMPKVLNTNLFTITKTFNETNKRKIYLNPHKTIERKKFLDNSLRKEDRNNSLSLIDEKKPKFKIASNTNNNSLYRSQNVCVQNDIISDVISHNKKQIIEIKESHKIKNNFIKYRKRKGDKIIVNKIKINIHSNSASNEKIYKKKNMNMSVKEKTAGLKNNKIGKNININGINGNILRKNMNIKKLINGNKNKCIKEKKVKNINDNNSLIKEKGINERNTIETNHEYNYSNNQLIDVYNNRSTLNTLGSVNDTIYIKKTQTYKKDLKINWNKNKLKKIINLKKINKPEEEKENKKIDKKAKSNIRLDSILKNSNIIIKEEKIENENVNEKMEKEKQEEKKVNDKEKEKIEIENEKVEEKKEENGKIEKIEEEEKTAIDKGKENDKIEKEGEKEIKKENKSPKNIKIKNEKNNLSDEGEENIFINHFKSHFALSIPGKDKLGKNKINQDTYIFLTSINGIKNFDIFGVLDGHGPEGHLVSKFISKYIQMEFQTNEVFKKLKDINKIYERIKAKNYRIIKNIFEKADHALKEEDIDSNHSGTTCVLVIHIGEHIICANVGDSRAILVYDEKNDSKLNYINVFPLSIDNKPDNPEEKERIYKMGGKIEQLMNQFGERIGPLRVWVKNKDYPGLAMSRSFGDYCGKKAGIISVPEITECNLSVYTKFIVICSDGIWEFLSNIDVMNLGKKYHLINNPKSFCKELVEMSIRFWKKEDIVVDDITIVTLFF